jgi:hypothetical protein
LDHAEHAMQLPAKEKDNEKMVGVPELFKSTIGPSSALLNCKPDHDGESGGHDPAGDTGSGREVESQELNRSRSGTSDRGVRACELAEVPHVGTNMDRGKDNNGPRGCDVEFDVVIERNDIVQGRLAEERDEVSADWEKNEDDIEMEDECGGTGNGEADTEDIAGTSECVLELVVQEAENDDQNVQKYVEAKYNLCSPAVDEPGVIALHYLGILHLRRERLPFDSSGGSHDALETASLRLVALERRRRGALEDDVWVGIESVDGIPTVGEIKAGGRPTGHCRDVRKRGKGVCVLDKRRNETKS